MSDLRTERTYGEHRPKPCEEEELRDLICRDLKEWMQGMYRWGKKVTDELNALLAAAGDPDKVPPPPPPPFE